MSFFYTKTSKSVCLVLIVCAVVNGEREIKPEELRKEHQFIKDGVQRWANQIGRELHKLSSTMTRTNKFTESFKPLADKIRPKDGTILIGEIAADLRKTMDKKKDAVIRIAELAEFLAYNRKTEEMVINETRPNAFNYYDADAIVKTDRNRTREEELDLEITENECKWYCHLDVSEYLYHNMYQRKNITNFFRIKSKKTSAVDSKCDCRHFTEGTKSVENYEWLPMGSQKKYENRKVNSKLSSVKVAVNIYNRDQEVLQGVRWSEPLDLVFKENAEKDPTLKYQYFTSPLGYMRHYPAVAWSKEQYDRTYDPRTRSWYTEAMTSPKDIIILLDRSGSMDGNKRKLSAHIVNNILDTLNDNDFINIYTFTNTTEPLVPCFADTLVQANEENLRLLREYLNVYKIVFAANITLGFEKGFEILKEFREKRMGSRCNQAIMLITEGLDYDYRRQIFNHSNWMYNTPVRVFTYELEINEEDSRNLEYIACANRGYFVNISLPEEVREKVLNYMNVMSRPINYDFKNKQTPIWSYLYIDLADRRYPNWLWRKYEGIQQREVFLDHVKREIYRAGKVFTSDKHMLLKDTHQYEQYMEQIKNDFDYMTTVSMPVYGRRVGLDVDLVGVAAVDVPIKLMKSLIPHHILGVNGYAFIVTNNGYLLMHPDHRPEFERIPKPTFNRVDFLEVEILDDDNPPRQFGKSIVALRKKLVQREQGDIVLNMKFAVDDLKRVVLSTRRYYFTELGPFSLGIALPDKYGLMVLNTSSIQKNYSSGLTQTKKWKVHPEWVYCTNIEADTPEEVIRKCLTSGNKKSLFAVLLFDAYATIWFEDKIPSEEDYRKRFQVKNVFMASQSGLTRWQNFVPEDKEDFQNIHTRAIDEEWYQRTVDENFDNDGNEFIYSVPFEISGFENDTLVTSTNTIFVEDEDRKTPVAVVGLQFNHTVLSDLLRNITQRPGGPCKSKKTCEYYTCKSERLDCFILDNNAYIIVSDNIEHTGRFIGDIKPDLMYHLVENRVYKPIKMFDYQAICYKPPPTDDKSSASTVFNFRRLFENLFQVTNWALATILMLMKSVVVAPKQFYKTIKNDTIAFEKLKIEKTNPTPCDHEMWLFTLGDHFSTSPYSTSENIVKYECNWRYVVERINNSNLIFMAVNGLCKVDTTHTFYGNPTPTEITYNESLPCHIAIHNNFTRRIYMKCYNRSIEDDELNGMNRSYCGHTWK